MARFRYKRKQLKHIAELPLTPLIDTALTLLIVFIIAVPSTGHNIKIDLPQGSCRQESKISQKITLAIDNERDIYLGATKIDVQDLSRILTPAMLQEHKGLVYVQADQALTYGFIFNVLDRLRSLEGVAHVVLVSKK